MGFDNGGNRAFLLNMLDTIFPRRRGEEQNQDHEKGHEKEMYIGGTGVKDECDISQLVLDHKQKTGEAPSLKERFDLIQGCDKTAPQASIEEHDGQNTDNIVAPADTPPIPTTPLKI